MRPEGGEGRRLLKSDSHGKIEMTHGASYTGLPVPEDKQVVLEGLFVPGSRAWGAFISVSHDAMCMARRGRFGNLVCVLGVHQNDYNSESCGLYRWRRWRC